MGARLARVGVGVSVSTNPPATAWLMRSTGHTLYLVPPEDPDSNGLDIGYIHFPIAADEIARRWNAAIKQD